MRALHIISHDSGAHLADDRAEEFRRSDKHVAGEQPSIGAPLHRQLLGRSDAPRDEIACHRLPLTGLSEFAAGTRPLELL